MKYVRAEHGKSWHHFKFRCYIEEDTEDCVPVDECKVQCGQFFYIPNIAELVDECHLPKNAKLCKRCFEET